MSIGDLIWSRLVERFVFWVLVLGGGFVSGVGAYLTGSDATANEIGSAGLTFASVEVGFATTALSLWVGLGKSHVKKTLADFGLANGVSGSFMVAAVFGTLGVGVSGYASVLASLEHLDLLRGLVVGVNVSGLAATVWSGMLLWLISRAEDSANQ